MIGVDSHHHFWQYCATDYPWIDESMAMLRRDFLPEQLNDELSTTPIKYVVSVQARQSVEETRWLLDLSQQHAWIAGVVGWLPLVDPDVPRLIEQFAEVPSMVAVRHVVQDEPDDEFILGEAFNRGVACLTSFDLAYDILVYGRQLQQAIRFVDRHPSQMFVLDHVGKPVIQGSQFDTNWATAFRELARRDNVACKFSGLVTECRDLKWDLDLIRPYWDAAWEAFGPERLMYGSDWPVCLCRTSYERWISAVTQMASSLSDDEQARFWGQNAIRTYRLSID